MKAQYGSWPPIGKTYVVQSVSMRAPAITMTTVEGFNETLFWTVKVANLATLEEARAQRQRLIEFLGIMPHCARIIEIEAKLAE